MPDPLHISTKEYNQENRSTRLKAKDDSYLMDAYSQAVVSTTEKVSPAVE